MQMQRELQGQVQRKEVERRYRDKCNKGPERDCFHQRKRSDRRGRESEC